MSDAQEEICRAVRSCFDQDSPTSRAIRSAVIGAVIEHFDDDSIVAALAAAAGPFATIYETPWDELSPLKQWIRQAAAEADRAVPALGDMSSVYNALVSAGNVSGPGLKLGAGVNVIGLDAENRRWLIPKLSSDALDAAAAASTRKAVREGVSRSGSVSFHWSIERTFLVPDPDDLRTMLPLPADGKYLIVYSGRHDIVSKPKFVAAFTAVANVHPVADLLVWDTSEQPSTLWSVRGMFGHRCGVDVDEWPAELHDHARRLSTVL